MDDLQLFTDGSGYEKKIGAAAITLSPPSSLQNHLGKDDSHTVFEGELTGMLLALQLVSDLPPSPLVLMVLDNQATILALQKKELQPGQYLLDALHNYIHSLRQ